MAPPKSARFFRKSVVSQSGLAFRVAQELVVHGTLI